MGLMKYITAFVVIGLFTLAILGFAINFAIDNDAPIDISDHGPISELYTQTRENASNFRDQTQDTIVSIMNSTIESGDTTTSSGGQFKITPLSALGVVTNIIRVGYLEIFGNDSGFGIFMTTLFSIFVFTIGLFIIKAWFGRNPE